MPYDLLEVACPPRLSHGCSAWVTVARSEGESAFVPIDGTCIQIVDRGCQTNLGVGAELAFAHVGIKAESTSSCAREPISESTSSLRVDVVACARGLSPRRRRRVRARPISRD